MQSLENTDPILNGDYQDRHSPLIKCLNAARRKGNKIFALKNGGECLSSSDRHVDVADRYKESSGCVEYKGSENAMNIYIIKGAFIHNYLNSIQPGQFGSFLSSWFLDFSKTLKNCPKLLKSNQDQ